MNQKYLSVAIILLVFTFLIPTELIDNTPSCTDQRANVVSITPGTSYMYWEKSSRWEKQNNVISDYEIVPESECKPGYAERIIPIDLLILSWIFMELSIYRGHFWKKDFWAIIIFAAYGSTIGMFTGYVMFLNNDIAFPFFQNEAYVNLTNQIDEKLIPNIEE